MSNAITLKVTLARSKTWRRLQVRADTRLYDFAAEICSAFNFDFDHAFGFYSTITGNYYNSTRRYELFADMDGNSEGTGVKRPAIVDAFPADRSKMLFLFDYGDDWMFIVQRETTAPIVRGMRLPAVIESNGKAPVQYPGPDDDDEGDEEAEPVSQPKPKPAPAQSKAKAKKPVSKR